jgi:iron complex transport system ATP-binding protein
MKITTDSVSVRYPGLAALALDSISIDVEPGTLYAVLGPNGSGKSTLMRALLGIAPLVGGRVVLDGRAFAEWDRRARARAVGAVSQSESIAFPLTARELVAMGRYPHQGTLSAEGPRDKAAIAAALEACDVARLAERDVTKLSGGEFQRTRIARALAQQPRALVLDEPTASLDIRHEMGILELLRTSANDGLTVVLITHGLDRAAEFADRLLLLSRGTVAAEGPPGEVLREDVLEDVYGWPVSVELDRVSGTHHVTPRRAPRARRESGDGGQ